MYNPQDPAQKYNILTYKNNNIIEAITNEDRYILLEWNYQIIERNVNNKKLASKIFHTSVYLFDKVIHSHIYQNKIFITRQNFQIISLCCVALSYNKFLGMELEFPEKKYIQKEYFEYLHKIENDINVMKNIETCWDFLERLKCSEKVEKLCYVIMDNFVLSIPMFKYKTEIVVKNSLILVEFISKNYIQYDLIKEKECFNEIFYLTKSLFQSIKQ